MNSMPKFVACITFNNKPKTINKVIDYISELKCGHELRTKGFSY